MAHKKYIFIAALLMGVFISMSVKCGTNASVIQCREIKQPAAAEYFERNNLLFIKYSF